MSPKRREHPSATLRETMPQQPPMRLGVSPHRAVPGLDLMRVRVSSLPLFWRVLGTNAVALVLATVALVVAPVTVSVPVAVSELIVLLAGLTALLALNLLMLRPAFRPLDQLAETMRRHDPLSPGERVAVDGEPDIAALAQAFNEMVERLESERRESARQALRVLEGERRRIARELHDEVGQTLTGVMLQIEALAAEIPPESREQLEELRETARRGAEDVRRIARQLRPEALEDLGLRSALAALASAFEEHARVRVDRRLEATDALSEDEELVVYRVAQEALTNVARHAGASRVDLSLEQREDQVVLTVTDDGRGLAPGTLPSANGIRGMRERAMLIGGRITIQGASGSGTQVRLAVAARAERT
jgi:two-component system, NarL family, sensor histidine kinase UhpB